MNFKWEISHLGYFAKEKKTTAREIKKMNFNKGY